MPVQFRNFQQTTLIRLTKLTYISFSVQSQYFKVFLLKTVMYVTYVWQEGKHLTIWKQKAQDGNDSQLAADIDTWKQITKLVVILERTICNR